MVGICRWSTLFLFAKSSESSQMCILFCFGFFLPHTALSTAGKPPDFSIKWVDDTHALAVYGSPSAGTKFIN